MSIIKSLFLGSVCSVAISLSGCATAPPAAPAPPPIPTPSLPQPYTQSGVSVKIDGWWTNGLGQVVGITGIARNDRSASLISCMVTLNVVDSDGVKVADAIASTTSLDPGQSWRFQATFTTPFTVAFKGVQPGKVIAVAQRRTG